MFIAGVLFLAACVSAQAGKEVPAPYNGPLRLPGILNPTPQNWAEVWDQKSFPDSVVCSFRKEGSPVRFVVDNKHFIDASRNKSSIANHVRCTKPNYKCTVDLTMDLQNLPGDKPKIWLYYQVDYKDIQNPAGAKALGKREITYNRATGVNAEILRPTATVGTLKTTCRTKFPA